MAHRGASQDEAEHTLAAYERALGDAVDGLECDVRLTRDGVLVCVHDRKINRTSTGRGVVSALELADLADLDFGSWHRGSVDGQDEAPDWDRTSVLTLDRLLTVIAERDRPIDLAIETKHPTRYAGLVELALIELLTKHRLLPCVDDAVVRPRVMSFATSSLRRVRTLAPTLPAVFLMNRLPMRQRTGILPAGAVAAGPSLRLLRAHPSYVDRVHRAGGEVHVWTVDRPEDIEYVAGLGVDVIITNRPRAVKEQLSARVDSAAG